ncbi:MAG: hypothetical protein FWE40_05480 [Oscillospiraceae bacterium]|nr:hypothetical protein [Oscillospiraceae bacterium]
MARGANTLQVNIGATVRGLFSGLKKAASGIRGFAQRGARMFRGLNRSMKSSSLNAKGLGKAMNGFFSVLRRQVSRQLLRTFTKQIGEAIGELARFSPAFNSAMSEIQSSVRFVGSALVAAFAPIVQAVAPWLVKLLNLLAEAINMITRFTAALMGQSQVATATRQQYDFAASMDAAAKSANDASNAMAAYDEINVLQTGQKDKGPQFQFQDAFGADGFDGGIFAAVKPLIYDAKNALKEVWELVKSIGRSFQAAWIIEGPAVVASLQHALSGVFNLVGSIARDWRRAWETDGRGEAIIGNLFGILSGIWGLIGDIAYAFYNAWNANDNGYRIMTSILNVIYQVTHIARDAIEVIREWWQSEAGQRFAYNITSAFARITESVSNIWDTIRRFWDNVGRDVFRAFLDVLSAVFEVIIEVVAAIISVAANVWDRIEPAVTWVFGNILLPFLDFVANGFRAIAALLRGDFGGALDFAGRAFRSLGNVGIGILNGIIHALNAVIGGLNRIQFTFPDWVPGLGGNSWGINIPKIPNVPQLATGGIVYSDMLVNVGEYAGARNNPEVIAPLDKLKDIIGQVGGAGERTIRLIMEYPDGRQIIKIINDTQEEAGYVLLEV